MASPLTWKGIWAFIFSWILEGPFLGDAIVGPLYDESSYHSIYALRRGLRPGNLAWLAMEIFYLCWTIGLDFVGVGKIFYIVVISFIDV